ncbi:MAG: NAD(P)H-dependent oxidoreductase [Patescibacteria group bacterium]
MTKVAVIVGSLREASLNKKFAHAFIAHASEGIEFVYADIDLPLYNGDLEASAYPEKAQALKDLIKSCNSVLVVTPEYNRGYPGVLKNAIDWISRPDSTEVLNNKPVVLAGVSGSALGTTQSQSQLRNVLIYLNTKLMGQPEAYINGGRFFTESGEVVEESKEWLQRYVDAAVAHLSSSN